MKQTPLTRNIGLAPGRPLTRSVELSRGNGFKPPLAVVRRDGAVVYAPAEWQRRRTDTGFSPAVKQAVRKRAGNGDPDEALCEACGRGLGRRAGEYQHVVARGMGGCQDPLINSAANCALLCMGCHRIAESRDREMGARGFWLPQGTDPRAVPMMLASEHGSGVLVWRTVDGRYLFEAPDGSSVA